MLPITHTHTRTHVDISKISSSPTEKNSSSEQRSNIATSSGARNVQDELAVKKQDPRSCIEKRIDSLQPLPENGRDNVDNLFLMDTYNMFEHYENKNINMREVSIKEDLPLDILYEMKKDIMEDEDYIKTAMRHPTNERIKTNSLWYKYTALGNQYLNGSQNNHSRVIVKPTNQVGF